MTRDLRFLHKPGAVVEITQRTFQGRHLLKPSTRFNALIVGCIARAQQKTGATIHAVAFLSNHFHQLASFESVQQMAAFMGQLKTNLSKEIGFHHDWPGVSWDHRYHSVPVSDEETAQSQRLRYLLEQGCKENLVMSPRDWPGVHSAQALTLGQPLDGIWIDRVAFHAARKKGQKARLDDFEQHLELTLTPLPCWAHLEEQQWRALVTEIVDEIEAETIRRHQREATLPLGAARVCKAHPWQRPRPQNKSPRPRFHAFTRAVRRALLEAYRQFLIVYREAADRLARGQPGYCFPQNCFPPRLPFVSPDPPGPG